MPTLIIGLALTGGSSRESHPPIWRLIPYLHKAEISAKKKKIDITHVWQDESKRKKKYQTVSHKLKRIVELYNPEDPHETLSKIANITKARTTLDSCPDSDSEQE